MFGFRSFSDRKEIWVLTIFLKKEFKKIKALLAQESLDFVEFFFNKIVILTNNDFVASRRSILHNTMSCSDHMCWGNQWATANVIELSSWNYPQWYLPRPRIWRRICSAYHTREGRSLATFRWKKGKKREEKFNNDMIDYLGYRDSYRLLAWLLPLSILFDWAAHVVRWFS